MKQAYHHRDLRNALIDEALTVLDTEGIGSLTLRELGRRLGVTHAAAYAHFPDKSALLREVAAIGFRRLAAACAAARSETATPRDAFDAMGRAYLAFARSAPNLYRLMFSDQSLYEHTSDAEPLTEGADAFEQLVGLVAQITRLDEERARELAIPVWGTVHGLAMLELDARIGGAVKAVADPMGLAASVLLDGLVRYDAADARKADLPG